MAYKNIDVFLKTMSFISTHKNCVSADIKEFLGIPPANPPTAEEQELYHLLRVMRRNRFLNKRSIPNKRPGGPRFTLELTRAGDKLLKRIRTALFDFHTPSNDNVFQQQFTNSVFSSIEEHISETLSEFAIDLVSALECEIAPDSPLAESIRKAHASAVKTIMKRIRNELV